MVKYLQLIQNMGWRYVWFRLTYEISRRIGWLKTKFPAQPPSIYFVGLDVWKKKDVQFFFESRDSLFLHRSGIDDKKVSDTLKAQIAEYRRGRFLFFSATYYTIPDWLTHPVSGYRYDATKHWTEIADFSAMAGDIKYVWEKSRFAFLYPLIRYDFQIGEDMAEAIFGEIDGWIDANPINCGPNWRCSQEISLRVLNWTFALHYYKNSPSLTEERFHKINHLIYWQMRHVEANINFSRIAVRNNHAITETLALYLVGLLYPYFPESNRWKEKGKKWFEEEIAYQIDEDGTFLQFSMNYHRVVIQLLTWAIRLADLNSERFEEVVYERAQKSLIFLKACQEEVTGWLPNYGNNDGALFFPLNDAHFRDYRPQLSALAAVLGEETEEVEDLFWYGFGQSSVGGWRAVGSKGLDTSYVGMTNETRTTNEAKPTTFSFPKGGYFTLKEADSLTFIRCGAYKNRPFQADNLHLDIWVNGDNILRDAGSYLYNTDEKWVKYFAGTASHNTVMLGEYDQMQKGTRFIWYDWVKEASGSWQSQPNLQFEGKIRAFDQVGKNSYHHRKVIKTVGKLEWVVEDWLKNAPQELPMHQIWHPSASFFEQFSIQAFNKEGHELNVAIGEGWYSGFYGVKEPVRRLTFTTNHRYIRTVIKQTTPSENLTG